MTVSSGAVGCQSRADVSTWRRALSNLERVPFGVRIVLGSISTLGEPRARGNRRKPRAIHQMCLSAGHTCITRGRGERTHSTVKKPFAFTALRGGNRSCEGKDREQAGVYQACPFSLVFSDVVALKSQSATLVLQNQEKSETKGKRNRRQYR